MSKSEKSALLESLITSLKQQRDELALQVHLGKAEARREWERVDEKWRRLLADYEPLRHAVGETADNVSAGLHLVAGEVREGFERVRKLLRKS